MSLGAFAVLSAKGRAGESDVLIDDLAGLASQRPWLAFALAVCMLSLLGFPGTAGFIGKWYILIAAHERRAEHPGRDSRADQRRLGGVLSSRYHGDVHETAAGRGRAHGCLSRSVGTDRRRGSGRRPALFGVWPNRLFDLAKSAGNSVHATAETAATPP